MELAEGGLLTPLENLVAASDISLKAYPAPVLDSLRIRGVPLLLTDSTEHPRRVLQYRPFRRSSSVATTCRLDGRRAGMERVC